MAQKDHSLVAIDRLNLSAIAYLFMLKIFRSEQILLMNRFEYFEASVFARKLVSILERVGFWQSQELDYSIIEVRDNQGNSAWGKYESEDTVVVCGQIFEQDLDANAVVRYLQRYIKQDRLGLYLKKCAAEDLVPELAKIQVVGWLHRARLAPGRPLYIAQSAFWSPQIREYAQKCGVVFKSYPGISIIGKSFKFIVKKGSRVARRFKKYKPEKNKDFTSHKNLSSSDFPESPVVAISYQGLGVGCDLSRSTDLFWVSYSKIPKANFLLYFSSADNRLENANLESLEKQGIRSVALEDRFAGSPGALVWAGAGLRQYLSEIIRAFGRASFVSFWNFKSLGVNLWVLGKIPYMMYRIFYWKAFFSHFKVCVHVDYSSYGCDRLAADQAMEDLGGVSVSFQRSDSYLPSVLLARSTSVHFSFSPAQIEKEIAAGSRVDNFVCTGYLWDGVFKRVRERSALLRERLRSKGAEFIVCFFDENSMDDKRKGPSHEHRAENYRFLLSKLFEDPKLGLIFKPKKPATLRRRLGPVNFLLDKAIATGRCYLVEGVGQVTSMLACEASQAADISVGLLNGSTAIMESALAGCRGLLLDREGFKFHPLCKAENITFTSWDDLWMALHSFRSGSYPALGDWKSHAGELDPFRDGSAVSRMAEFIGQLFGGMQKGLSREESLTQAVAQHKAAWGAGLVQ